MKQLMRSFARELADKGIRFGRERREAPSLRFASSGAVSFSGSMSGETDKAISAIAKLDAGLKMVRVSPDFTADLGFVPRTDFTSFTGSLHPHLLATRP